MTIVPLCVAVTSFFFVDSFSVAVSIGAGIFSFFLADPKFCCREAQKVPVDFFFLQFFSAFF
jgi:hypothetical protein